jgi:hypothetical protein
MPHLSTIKSDEHAKALLERDQFLLDHPELLSLQEKIDDRLKKADSTQNRLVVIHDLMMESFFKLDKQLKTLARELRSHGSAE